MRRGDMKSSAKAHPIQGLVKYHGLKDPKLRIPFHDSISVATAPTETHTTVEFGDFERDTATIDGKDAGTAEMGRILSVVDEIRAMSHISGRLKMVSVNNFPSNVGLGASASGFAALTVAACHAAGLDLSLKEMSVIARRGAGSAARSVTGAFSLWKTGHEDSDSYSCQLVSEEFQMGIVVALIPAHKLTDDAHRDVLESPFFHSRLAYIHGAISEMKSAIKRRDIERIGVIAEKDSLILHGITMTGLEELILWRPETIKVILEVKEMRRDGIPAYFSIDTGATVYVNTLPERVKEVVERIRSLGIETIECGVGGNARVTDKHLF